MLLHLPTTAHVLHLVRRLPASSTVSVQHLLRLLNFLKTSSTFASKLLPHCVIRARGLLYNLVLCSIASVLMFSSGYLCVRANSGLGCYLKKLINDNHLLASQLWLIPVKKQNCPCVVEPYVRHKRRCMNYLVLFTSSQTRHS